LRVRYACVLALLVLAALAPPAGAKITCDSGTTAFVDGNLRIFGIHYRTSFERGFEEYACLGRRRPQLVGGVGSDEGRGSGETSAYAHAGRYLASYERNDGEGGPSAHVRVVDLVRRRTVSFANVACCEWTPSLRLAPDGTVVVLSPGEGLFVKAPGRRARTLVGEGEGARDLAVYGSTVYWTQGGEARAAILPGLGGGEATALEPVRLRRRGGPCRAARGRTVAASGSVRVYETGDRRLLCRVDRDGRLPMAGATVPRVVGDRWLLSFGPADARVVDSRTGRTVTRAQPVSEATLLRDGTLAWTDFDGGAFARRPGGKPVVLAAGGARRLAAARRAVYWTENGVPRVYPPSSAARSASKPG
jgi:hypothetical protein